ncbi:hypothetical protein YC2023_105790 [Brassica napus]
MSKVCKDWSFTSNHASDPDGRIIIIWKNPAAVSILHQSRQSLTCEVNIAGTIKFIFTAIYAANLASDRADLWVDLLSIQQLHQLDICPWVVGGDFNQITHFAEHSSPTVNHLDPPMTDFRNTLTQLGLFDLRYLGPLFTWSNKCPTYPVAKKLDRFLVNHPWIASHPHSQANFLAPEVSDHSPAILDLAVDLPRAGTKPFKFYNFLTKHPDFCQLVRALTDPTSANFQEEKTVMAKLVFLRSIEESYFRQRSRICWLKEGDHNTSFFHRLTQVRNSNNSIRSFCLANGDIISDPIAMGQIAISHFKNILAPPFLPITTSSPLWIQNLTDYRCPQELHNSLTSFPLAPSSCCGYSSSERVPSGWPDNWSPYGNLRQYFGLAPTTSLGIRASATLHDLFQQEVNDEYTWSPLGSPLSTFSTGQVYNEIRPHQQKVPWHASIWSSRGCKTGGSQQTQLVFYVLALQNQETTCFLNVPTRGIYGRVWQEKQTGRLLGIGILVCAAYRDPPSQNSIDYSSSSHGKPPYTSSGLNATTVSIGSSFGQLRLSRGKPTCSSETASQASETKTPDSPPQCSSFGLIDDLLSV